MTASAQLDNGKVTKPRPRRPNCIAPGDLPDDSLVAKDIRRAVTGLGDSQTYSLIQRPRKRCKKGQRFNIDVPKTQRVDRTGHIGVSAVVSKVIVLRRLSTAAAAAGKQLG